MRKNLIEPTRTVCEPPPAAEQVILTLARTHITFTRNHLNEAMTTAGIETCYEKHLEKVEADGFIEVVVPGVWRSLIFRGSKP